MKDKAKYESMQNLTLAKQLESRMKKHNFIKYFDQLPAKLHDERIKWLNGEQIYTINYGCSFTVYHANLTKYLILSSRQCYPLQSQRTRQIPAQQSTLRSGN